jgi:hypothetical protein
MRRVFARTGRKIIPISLIVDHIQSPSGSPIKGSSTRSSHFDEMFRKVSVSALARLFNLVETSS